MTTDWQNRGGTMQAGLNLAPMDLNKEHIFELMNVEIQEGVTTKFGIKTKVKTVWKESEKNENYHRVWCNFNESYTEKSNLVKFLQSVSHRPIMPGTPVMLGDFLVIGMRIRVMVQARIDKEKGIPSGYYDFIPASIKPFNTQTTMPPNPSQIVPIGVSHGPALQNALLIARGSQNAADAAYKFAEARSPLEITQAFRDADKAGLVKYPIQ